MSAISISRVKRSPAATCLREITGRAVNNLEEKGLDVLLFTRHRLNVATSRAQSACIVVFSPRLFEPECRTPRQMQLANALASYRERVMDLRPPDVG